MKIIKTVELVNRIIEVQEPDSIGLCIVIDYNLNKGIATYLTPAICVDDLLKELEEADND